MAKVAYVDHSYHKKTLSNIFLTQILFKYGHSVDFFWDDAWKGGKSISFDQVKDYDVVILFQCHCERTSYYYSQLHPNVIGIPMLDQFQLSKGITHDYRLLLEPFQGSKILAFSENIFAMSLMSGIACQKVRYYQPLHSIQSNHKKGLHGFFWMRNAADVSWLTIRELIRGTAFDSFHLHVAPDPFTPEPILPTTKENIEYNITITKWFDTKEEYFNIFNKANIFFAPRCNEGIGQSFLEAFTFGHCVVAPNYGTMNEYILHGINGLLYDPKSPMPLDFSNAPHLGMIGYSAARIGRQEWLKRIDSIVDFILCPSAIFYSTQLNSSSSSSSQRMYPSLKERARYNIFFIILKPFFHKLKFIIKTILSTKKKIIRNLKNKINIFINDYKVLMQYFYDNNNTFLFYKFILYIFTKKDSYICCPLIDPYYYRSAHLGIEKKKLLHYHLEEGIPQRCPTCAKLNPAFHLFQTNNIEFKGDVVLRCLKNKEKPQTLNLYSSISTPTSNIKTEKFSLNAYDIIVFTSIAPTRIELQCKALATWQKQGLKPVAINYPDEIKKISPEFSGITFLPPKRNSYEEIGKSRIFLNDIFEYAAEFSQYKNNICGIINSDVGLYSLNLNKISSIAKDNLIFSRRNDIENEIIKPYDFGYDVYFFNPVFFKNFPFSTLALGEPWWDLALPLFCLLKKINIVSCVPPICYHSIHPIKWNEESWKKYAIETANIYKVINKQQNYEEEKFAHVVYDILNDSENIHKLLLFANLNNSIINTTPNKINGLL